MADRLSLLIPVQKTTVGDNHTEITDEPISENNEGENVNNMATTHRKLLPNADIIAPLLAMYLINDYTSIQ
jgi:hypothetical protein